MSHHEDDDLLGPLGGGGDDDLGSLGATDSGGLTDTIGQQLDAPSDVPLEPYGGDVSAEELMATGQVQPPPSMACDEATMVCLRGPCVHMWTQLTRMEAQTTITSIQRTQACARHWRLMSLMDENIFQCSDWWPRTLRWVPSIMRPYLLDTLTALWESKLKAGGESFSWRWWPRDVFGMSSTQVKALRDAAMDKAEAAEARAAKSASPIDDAFDL